MIDTEIEVQETEVAEVVKRGGFAIPLNRKVTADMIAVDPELAFQITVNRVADAFDNRDAFISFCEKAWDYKLEKSFQEFEALLGNLSDEQKEALVKRLQPAKKTTRKVAAED